MHCGNLRQMDLWLRHYHCRLLRFLQDHVAQRVGSKKSIAMDVRVIAATNLDPIVQIRNNKLREDFYYRLSVVSIHLAPLKHRLGDIERLTRYFLDLCSAKYGREMSSISPGAIKLLEAYEWPGNIRQLEHMIGQIVITKNGTELTENMLPTEITNEQSATQEIAWDSLLDTDSDKTIPSIREMEHRLILQTLESTSDSIPEAAKRLGLSEATLYRKIKKFGLSRSFGK